MTERETVKRVHADAMVIDAHADIEVPGKESPYVGPDGRSRVAPDKMAAGGMDAAVMSVAVGPGQRTPEGFAKARPIFAEHKRRLHHHIFDLMETEDRPLIESLQLMA